MDLLADTSDAGKAMSWMLHCPQSDFEANLDHKNFENVVVLRDPLRFIVTLQKSTTKFNAEQLLKNGRVPFDELHPFDLKSTTPNRCHRVDCSLVCFTALHKPHLRLLNPPPD